MGWFSTNDQGQLKNRAVNAKSVSDRKIDELIGICRGIVADGVVNQQETEFLISWISSNIHLAPQYPFDVLYRRISEMLSDGIMDNDEKTELLSILNELTGGDIIDHTTNSMSTTLPLCSPAPEILIKDKSFVFTGVFTTGPRKQLEQIVVDLGGVMHSNVTKDTNYLIIGDIGSQDWAHSSFGRKIEKAIGLREKGTGISIVIESHWARFI